jgi:hypothetical protein
MRGRRARVRSKKMKHGGSHDRVDIRLGTRDELGPTLDVAFASDPNPNYVSVGIPEMGMSVWF